LISYVIPTRDRPHRLARTIARLALLDREAHERIGGGEVIIIDNASIHPPDAPSSLPNGLAVRVIRRSTNEGAAARNVAAEQAAGSWLLMLDDDSWPLDARFIDELLAAPQNLAAIGAEIVLPDQNRRQEGGLPEVFIGCGAAVRADAFREVGGYEPAFGYYAEEYDLSAKLLLAGYRVAHTRAFRAAHCKAPVHRDVNRIIQALVRNNGWVVRRYAPPERLEEHLNRVNRRYEAIARKENAEAGFDRGLAELRRSIDHQPRRAMSDSLYDRFIGLAAARDGLREALARRPIGAAAILARGKHDWVIEQALRELNVKLAPQEAADALIVGTLSPGPAMDAETHLAAEYTQLERVTLWRPQESIKKRLWITSPTQ